MSVTALAPIDSQPAILARRIRRIPLVVKLATAMIGLVVVVLVINNGVATWLAYQEAKRSVLALQTEKAESAAKQIDGFMSNIVGQIGWTTGAEWRHLKLDEQRTNFIRLLRQVPAITELLYVNAAGAAQLKVSRLEPDEVGRGTNISADPRLAGALTRETWFGPVTFRHGSEPYMAITLRHVGDPGGVTIAEVNLKLIAYVVAGITSDDGALAYVVDGAGKLIAHPDMSLVLRDTDMSRLAQVNAALAAGQTATLGENLEGDDVLSAGAVIPRLGWAVFVEAPVQTALYPVYAVASRAGILLIMGLLAAAILGAVLARRLTDPLRRLEAGAERFGSGDLSERIDVGTRDEIAILAERFNTMAQRIQEAQETLEGKVRERTRDLDEALTFQKASADVLAVLSRSPDAVEPVVQAILETACRLCRADTAAVRVVEEAGLRLLASSLLPGSEGTGRELIPLDETSLAGRAVLGQTTIHIADITADPGLTSVRRIGSKPIRTGFSVPLIDGGRVTGAIVLLRQTSEPFAQRELEIVESFADHVVIAMANGRLFAALNERTEALSRSLEDLRATQDLLIQTEKLASLGALTAGIAHEIKNPLNFVNNFASLSAELLDELTEHLEEADLSKAVRDDIAELSALLKTNLAKIAAHGARADSIMRNMLLHSRSGSGEREPVTINLLAEETLNLTWHGARANDPGFQIEIERDFDGKAGTVEGFPQELSRVLLNLLTNAFDAVRGHAVNASPDFRPTVRVSTRDLGHFVEIVVRDNGPGVPPNLREKIFEPFFTTKPAGKGTGLGLSLSHDIIVKQHGGRIEVSGEEGTEFHIRLPRRMAGEV